MNPGYVNSLLLLLYLILGTVSIALAAGWTLKQFGPLDQDATSGLVRRNGMTIARPGQRRPHGHAHQDLSHPPVRHARRRIHRAGKAIKTHL